MIPLSKIITFLCSHLNMARKRIVELPKSARAFRFHSLLRPIAQFPSFSLVVPFLKQEVQLTRCCILLESLTPYRVVLF